MTEKHKLHDGTPLASFEDATEFLSSRADKACPACGHAKWNLYISHDGTSFLTGLGLVGLNLKTSGILTSGLPVVIGTCEKCAFMRMHSLFTISKWAANGKPNFDDAK